MFCGVRTQECESRDLLQQIRICTIFSGGSPTLPTEQYSALSRWLVGTTGVFICTSPYEHIGLS